MFTGTTTGIHQVDFMESGQAKPGHDRFRKEVLKKNKDKKRFAGEDKDLNVRNQVLATYWNF